MRYDFEWDRQKAATNIRKHGVSFDSAATVFLDPQILSIFDHENSDFEERWITVGIDSTGRLLTVCHTYRQELKVPVIIRIFSARKSTAREIEQYKE